MTLINSLYKLTGIRLLQQLTNTIFFQAIRRSLVMAIPILTVGSLSLVLHSFPIPFYQNFIHTFANGFLFNLFNQIYTATFGVFSLYMVTFISLSLAELRNFSLNNRWSIPAVGIICFIILSGTITTGASLSNLGVNGLFTAIFAGIVGTTLYIKFATNKRYTIKLYADGVNADFNNTLSLCLPIGLTILCFAIFHMLIIYSLGVSNFHDLFIHSFTTLFTDMGRSLLSILLYIFLSSFLWFFGIHGGNFLQSINENLFFPDMTINQLQQAAGHIPTDIYTKTFLDNFILMGGCGASLSLLLAIFLFSKQHSNQHLAKIATLPMIFNINELLVFGLPIAFNPFMLIPFIITPLVIALTCYFAFTSGLVPVPTVSVPWTTPILLSGYLATGSIAGPILQMINIIIGISIYRPFLISSEQETINNIKQNLAVLTQKMKDNEASDTNEYLTNENTAVGAIAKMLAIDLQNDLYKQNLTLFYQPQHDNTLNCIGVEALLRWNHPICGMIYPPLVLQLAKETNLLYQLECHILETVVKAQQQLPPDKIEGFKISVNITPASLNNADFETFLENLVARYHIKENTICLEITEQMAFQMNYATEAKLQHIRALGFQLAIDDFSMGHTSIKYLQSNFFNIVKIDGALVSNMKNNPRCQDIIKSITQLAISLDFNVVAEYVETTDERETLEKIGCTVYQGYLYSPAISLSELQKYLR